MDNLSLAESYKSFQNNDLANEKSGFGCVQHGSSTAGLFSDDSRGIHARTGYDRSVYEHYRPNETILKGNSQEVLRKIIMESVYIYERVGIIHSTIDMMSEFVAEGVEIVHPDEEPHKFYAAWSKKVNLEDRAERMASWLFKAGNVVSRRVFGQLDKDVIRRMRRSNANELDMPGDGAKFGYIPIQYIFYNPAHIEVVGGEIMALSNKKQYGLRLNNYTLQKISKDPSLLKTLPEEIQALVNGKNRSVINIPTNKLFVGHFKKDDTDLWAKPFLYSIFADVYYNDKVKMAKTVTLDNMISTVRIWRLGDHKEQLLPTPAAGTKLTNILMNNTGGGPIDIIWDSTLQFEEHFPPIDKLADFSEDNNSILLGLGVPDTLVGGESNGKGSLSMTTLGLKNMIKRMEAARRVIMQWLNEEIDIIQKNMGFRRRPSIRFAHADLYDDRTYFNLLLQLVDRNILPDDRILEILGEIPEFEKYRVSIQEKDRETGNLPPKAGAYHNPQLEDMQQHEIDKLNTNNEGKKVLEDTKESGRPDNSKDTVKRVRGPNKRRSLGSLMIESNKIYNFVDEIVNKIMLAHFNEVDLRKLTSENRAQIDSIKLQIFPRIKPFTDLSESNIMEYINNTICPTEQFYEYYTSNMAYMKTNEDKRTCRIGAYAQSWYEFED